MDRRRVLALLATAGCGLATGCDDFNSADRDRFFGRLRLDVHGIRITFDTLKSTIEDFKTKDWRQVVSELNDNISQLEKEISEVEVEINPDPDPR